MNKNDNSKDGQGFSIFDLFCGLASATGFALYLLGFSIDPAVSVSEVIFTPFASVLIAFIFLAIGYSFAQVIENKINKLNRFLAVACKIIMIWLIAIGQVYVLGIIF